MNRIKDFRENAKLTQQQLSNILSIDRSTVAKWEAGDTMPRADKLPELAKVLECSIDELFTTNERKLTELTAADNKLA